MAIRQIISRNLPGINALNIALVEETEPSEYKTRFFFFVRATPSVKSDTSPTGRTYDNKASISFKMEAEKLLSLSFALKQYALGKGKNYIDVFGEFQVFADASKSQFGEGGKKSIKLGLDANKNSGKISITLFFSAENQKGIPFFFTPYDAHALADAAEILAKKCIEMEMSGPGIVVANKVPSKQYNNQQQNFQNNQNPFGSNIQQPPEQDNRSDMNRVVEDFSNVFENNPFGMS